MGSYKLAQPSQLQSILNEIRQLADSNSLRTKAINTQRGERKANYLEQAVELNLSGDFHGFYSFLLQLEKSPRMLRLARMNMHKSGDGQLLVQMTLNIYFDTGAPAQTNRSASDSTDMIEQLQQMQDQQGAMARQIGLMATLTDNTPRSSVLAQVVNSLPRGVSLVDFTLDGSELKVSAVAQTDEQMTRFANRLRTSKMWHEPKLAYDPSANDGDAQRNFQINTTLNTEPSTDLQSIQAQMSKAASAVESR